MGQTLGAKGRSRRRTKRPAQNRLRIVVTYLLLISIVFSNISNPLFNVFAGQKTEKEEFRIYADELQRAAEEAFDDDEPLEEALEIDSKDKTLLKNYQKLFEADGRLYEIFPEYETVNEIDGITLRTFIRIAEDADPKSYMLTGEEELIFLYVNDGDASVSCRVNIDGYISAYCTVKPYESVFGENEETIISGSGVTAGTGSGSGSGSGSGQTAEEAPVKDETAAAEDTKETEAPADTTDEENSQKEENGAADKADEAPAEDDKADETGDKDDAEAPADDSRDEESENTGDEADASENTGDSDTADEADGSDSNDSSDDTADEADGSDDGGDTADEGGSSDNGDTSDDVGSSDDDSSVEIGMSINVRHLLATSIQAEEEEEAEETEEEEPEETEAETEESTEAETEESTEAETEESTEAETEESTEAETEESTEAAEAEAEEGAADAETKETTAGTVPETAVMADTPYAVKIVDEEEEDAFERVGSLDGKTYNIVALEQYKTARAFVIDFSESGLDKETLESTGHFITYTVDPTGSAELVHTARLVRDGAEVAFGIVPQEGYKITEVTSNGDELAIIDIADVERTATASEATRSEAVEDATRSEALREDAIYYEIPEVLEDQEVMILLEEIVPGSHPAFHQAKTVNGVTVSVSAEEGILPEGTELSVEEVTEQVEEVVKEKVESESEDDTVVNTVIAYDINLMLDGKKLNNDWGESNYVTVQFSGERIAEASKEADSIQIATLKTPTETVEAALGGNEEMPLVDNLTADDIEVDTEGREPIAVEGENTVDVVEMEASHFTVYVLYTSGKNTLLSNVSARYYIQSDENYDFVTDTGVSYKFSEDKDVTFYNKDTMGPFIQNRALNVLPVLDDKSDYAHVYYMDNNNVREVTTFSYTNNQIRALFGTSGSNDYVVYDANNWTKFYWTEVTEKDPVDVAYVATLDWDKADTNDAVWVALGDWYATDIPSPMQQAGGGVSGASFVYREPNKFPKLTINGKDYTYTEDITKLLDNDENYYTVEWKRLVAADGTGADANCNSPGNTTYEFSRRRYHRDGLILLCDQNPVIIFEVLYPGESDFIIDPDIENSVQTKLNKQDPTSAIIQPIPKELSGYVFSGWCTTKACTEKAVFDNTAIGGHRVYYGKYVKAGFDVQKVLEQSDLHKNAEITNVQFQLVETDNNWSEKVGVDPISVYVDANGQAAFDIDIRAGYYLLKESKTADGYMGLKEPIKITVQKVIQNGITSLEYTIVPDEKDTTNVTVAISPTSGRYVITVINNPIGTPILPDTGGSGFYDIKRLGWMLVLISLMMGGIELHSSKFLKRKNCK